MLDEIHYSQPVCRWNIQVAVRQVADGLGQQRVTAAIGGPQRQRTTAPSAERPTCSVLCSELYEARVPTEHHADGVHVTVALQQGMA